MEPAATAWVERWLTHLRTERRLSPHTRSAYARDLGVFAAYCSNSGITGWGGLDTAQLKRFAALQHRDGLDPRSIQRRLSSVRSFLGFLVREGVLELNPAKDVRAPKGRRQLPRTLDTDRMARLLLPPTDHLLARRDHAIMELLYSSGLRLAELVGLDLQDLDLAERTVRVLGKGQKERIVPVGSKAVHSLRRWLGERTALARPGEAAVFLGRSGRRLGARAIQKRLAEAAHRQGIDMRVHPHLFRHSFASHLLESSGDLRGVQEMLGHANLSTTQVYTHLDFQHLARTYDSSHPRARRRK